MEGWWQAQQDDRDTSVHPPIQGRGVVVHGPDGRVLQLKPATFRLLTEVTLDCVRFMDMPEGF